MSRNPDPKYKETPDVQTVKLSDKNTKFVTDAYGGVGLKWHGRTLNEYDLLVGKAKALTGDETKYLQLAGYASACVIHDENTYAHYTFTNDLGQKISISDSEFFCNGSVWGFLNKAVSTQLHNVEIHKTNGDDDTIVFRVMRAIKSGDPMLLSNKCYNTKEPANPNHVCHIPSAWGLNVISDLLRKMKEKKGEEKNDINVGPQRSSARLASLPLLPLQKVTFSTST